MSERLAYLMHKEWLILKAEQGYHLPEDCRVTHCHPCAKCRDDLVRWGHLSEEVREVNRRGVRRFLCEVGITPEAAEKRLAEIAAVPMVPHWALVAWIEFWEKQAEKTEAAEARVVALEGGIRDVLRIVRTEPHTPTDEVIERRLAGLFPSEEVQGG